MSQEEDQLLPATSHRLPASWTAGKDSWLDSVVTDGGETVHRPLPPDWSELTELRRKQRKEKDQGEQKEPLMAEPRPFLGTLESIS